MDAKLVVTSGKTSKRTVQLNLPAVLGRSREADITVAHPMISRRHCELYEHDGLLMLRDLTSLNGTLIGGRKVSLAPLLPNGEFSIGPIVFRVMYQYTGDLAAVPEIDFAEPDPIADSFADPVDGYEAQSAELAGGDFEITPEGLNTDPLGAEQADDSVQVRMPDLAWADAEDAEIEPAPAEKRPRPATPAAKSPVPPVPKPPVPKPNAPAVPANVHPLRNLSVPRDKLPTVPLSPTPMAPTPIAPTPPAPFSPPPQQPAADEEDAPWAAGPPAHHHGPKPAEGDFGSFLEGLQ
jgi:hypothetical protein